MTVRYLPVIHVEDLPETAQTASGLARAVREEILSTLAEMSAATPDQEKLASRFRGNDEK